LEGQGHDIIIQILGTPRHIHRGSRKREDSVGVVAMLKNVIGKVKIGLSNLGGDRSEEIR